MTLFQPLSSDRIPRRMFLWVPLIFGALIAVFRRGEHPLPDPSEPGTGPEVTIVLFHANGERDGILRVRKTVKSDSEWRRLLWAEEYLIARSGGTEIAYTGRYWNNHERGIYRCVCCGNALFRSEAKYDSETGWPSFSAPIAEENVAAREDNSLGVARIETLCQKCDAHLGHRFNDGPEPAGLRYCMNSAALRLVQRS